MTKIDRSARERGVILRKIDFAATLADSPNISPCYPAAIGRAKSGKVYMILNEGVGYDVTDLDAIKMFVWVKDEGGSYQGEVEIPFGKIIYGEDIDLADHVRVFGSRLESNFHIWHGKMTDH